PRPAAAPSQPPASAPWANGGSGYTTDTSTTDTGDPEF
ncbi:single-stranded DNA-binding protein, partial [Bifidobacterium adolescentis]